MTPDARRAARAEVEQIRKDWESYASDGFSPRVAELFADAMDHINRTDSLIRGLWDFIERAEREGDLSCPQDKADWDELKGMVPPKAI